MKTITGTTPITPAIDYKYNEGELFKEITEYIDATYDEHYAQNKYQATEIIIDSGHGEGFLIGNIMKYAKRYGKKDGYRRRDLLKIIHYGIMMLSVHDKEHENNENTDNGSAGIRENDVSKKDPFAHTQR